jgi:hypothetical protein
MGQHFLLSLQVRDLTITQLSTMQERIAKKWFRQARWPETDGKPYCPHCGNLRCYEMSRERFKCSAKECKAVFTVTSGTVFAWRKLPFELWRILGDEADQAALCAGIGMTSMPSWNLTPAITFGNWFSPISRRQVFEAAITSLNTISRAVVEESEPLVRTVR